MQVVDYYGVAVSLSAIMVATDGKQGVLWACGTLLLGCPVALAYIAYKLHTGSIQLVGRGSYAAEYY